MAADDTDRMKCDACDMFSTVGHCSMTDNMQTVDEGGVRELARAVPHR